MKIVFSGGGTLGPVTPLLAMHKQMLDAHPDATFLWVGTKQGPEKELVEKAGIPFVSIASGKWRRYITLKNFDVLNLFVGFCQSVAIIWRENPTVCISAGGFVSVPLHIAAWFFGVPTWIHQQDVRVGLSNKLMAPFAKQITTALAQSVASFSKKKTFHLGNPVREQVLQGSKKKAQSLFSLKKSLPVVFATGGGTGSSRVNQLVVESVHHLDGAAEIIHLSGKERPQELVERSQEHFDTYHSFQFFTHEMAHAYAAADIVIARGGFGTLTEIAALGKTAIIIPKPGHQEDNVRTLAEEGAVLLVDERTANGHFLANLLKNLLDDEKKRRQLGRQLQHMLPIAKREDMLTLLSRFVDNRS